MHRPTLSKSSSTISLILFTLLFSHMAFTQDISNEQRNAYEARQMFNKSKSAYESASNRLSNQEKRVAEEQSRLDQARQEEQAAKTALEQSKANLDNKVDALNQVWDLRDK